MKRTERALQRTELVQRMHRRQQHLCLEDVTFSVDVILEAIALHLASGWRVEIRKFGMFTTRLRRPLTGHNPKTGQRVDVPIRRVPRFRASRSLLSGFQQKKNGGSNLSVLLASSQRRRSGGEHETSKPMSGK